MLSTLTPFLSNLSQYVIVDGCKRKLVKLCVRRAAGLCFGLVIVPPVHLGAFFHSGNKPIGFADNSTLISITPQALELPYQGHSSVTSAGLMSGVTRSRVTSSDQVSPGP